MQSFSPLKSLPQPTDDAGRFRFEDVAPGEAMVIVAATSWAVTVTKVEVLASSTSQLRVTMTKGASIVGTIRDINGDPVQGARIVSRSDLFDPRIVLTDREGRYALENVPPGNMSLVASRPLTFGGGRSAEARSSRTVRRFSFRSKA